MAPQAPVSPHTVWCHSSPNSIATNHNSPAFPGRTIIRKETIIGSCVCGLITAAGAGIFIQPLTCWLLDSDVYRSEQAGAYDLVNAEVIFLFFLIGSIIPLSVHIARGGRCRTKFDPLFGVATLVVVISLLLYRFFLFSFISWDCGDSSSRQAAEYLAFLTIHTIGPALVLALMKNFFDRSRNDVRDKMESNHTSEDIVANRSESSR